MGKVFRFSGSVGPDDHLKKTSHHWLHFAGVECLEESAAPERPGPGLEGRGGTILIGSGRVGEGVEDPF